MIYLVAVTDAVTVAIPVVWIGAKGLFRQVVQAIIVGIAIAISCCPWVETIFDLESIQEAVAVAVGEVGVSSQSRLFFIV